MYGWIELEAVPTLFIFFVKLATVAGREEQRTEEALFFKKRSHAHTHRTSVFRLRRGATWILHVAMRKSGFLSAGALVVLQELARNGLAEHRLARRPNALILLDRGIRG